MLNAEKKCAKPPAPPYSKHLAGLNKIIRYQKKIKSGINTGHDVLAAATAIRADLPKDLVTRTIKTKSVESHIRQAIKEYRNNIPNARELQQNQIKEWASAAAKNGDKTKEQHYKAMANAKNSKDTFRLLRHCIKPMDKSGIRRLKIPVKDEEGNIIKDNKGKKYGNHSLIHNRSSRR